jgi:hypothetical protein
VKVGELWRYRYKSDAVCVIMLIAKRMNGLVMVTYQRNDGTASAVTPEHFEKYHVRTMT